MSYKSQELQNIRIRIHSIKEDGTDNTGDAANLSTIIFDPSGNELVGTTDYTDATFDEVGTTGVYECLFPTTAPTKVFTSIDQANTYTVILISATAEVGSSGKDIRIVSQYTWETALDSTVAKETTVDNLNNFDPANDDVAVVTLVGTTTTNTDMRGTDSAALATTLSTVADNILNIQGLVLHNHVEDDIVRDGNGNKTSSILYNYDSIANATTHDKSTGLLSKHNVTVTYTGTNVSSLKVIEAV